MAKGDCGERGWEGGSKWQVPKKIFETLCRTYKDSAQKIDAILEEKYNAAVALTEEGKYAEAANIFRELGDYRYARARWQAGIPSVRDSPIP